MVHAKDKVACAHFLSAILGLPKPRPFGPFMAVDPNGHVLEIITRRYGAS